MTYKSLEDVAEDLPDNSPRFVLLSYPMTLVCSSLLRACLEGESCCGCDRTPPLPPLDVDSFTCPYPLHLLHEPPQR